MLDYIPQLILYVSIAAITPGPNNTIAFYVSYNFGLKKAILLPVAAAIGTTAIQLLCCLGIGSILINIPIIQNIMKFIGFSYLIYLSYQIFKFKLSENQDNQKKITLVEFFLFQFVNPKLYVFASSTAVIFTNYSYDFVLESIIISTIMGLLTIIAISTWVVAGNILLNLLRNDLQRKIINYLLGFALILTAIWIILT
ncbi:MAG: Cysteine/O-acetylserine efflux protein [Alphaproteobacteria bacterium MarineAlpha5_Bin11]|nr:hypothetical protein [Pelagibacteraceae bacterium]PPR43801.1 MAG: Cysteine/O-acetylserine efflux protein [Alphaproteobacteria bacterium MarineAlpha5_Bin11]|tara:strand:+ start:1635 stop:2228 length:594 start_codon:yes stop_codon:yes gene_type:complete